MGLKSENREKESTHQIGQASHNVKTPNNNILEESLKDESVKNERQDQSMIHPKNRQENYVIKSECNKVIKKLPDIDNKSDCRSVYQTEKPFKIIFGSDKRVKALMAKQSIFQAFHNKPLQKKKTFDKQSNFFTKDFKNKEIDTDKEYAYTVQHELMNLKRKNDTEKNKLNPSTYKLNSEHYEEKIKFQQIRNTIDSLKKKDSSFENDIKCMKIAFIEDDSSEKIKYFKKNLNKFKENKITQEIIDNFILDIIAEEELFSKFEIQEWDIHSILINIVENEFKNLEGENIDILKKLLIENQSNFPNKQFGILFEIGSKKDNLMKNYLRNLKFNQKFEMQTFNFQMHCGNEYPSIYKEISEIIECNIHLNSVVIKLSFEDFQSDGDTPNAFEDFMFILQSIQINSNLKNIAFSFVDNYDRAFPEFIDKSLFDIVEKGTYFSVLIEGYPFHDNNYELFFDALSKNSNLRFIGLFFQDDIKIYIDKITNTLKGHKSLIGVALYGNSFDDSTMNFLRKECPHLLLFLKNLSLMD